MNPLMKRISYRFDYDEHSNNWKFRKGKVSKMWRWYYEDDGVCDTCGYPWNE